MAKEDFEEEKEKLKNTLEVVEGLLDEEKKQLENLYDAFIGNQEDLLKLLQRKNMHINNLEFALNKPYFARIDFIADDNNKKQTVYIGKNGIIDGTDIVVTDWRAPISSLYYDSEVGKCSYESPGGIIDGSMDLKRQYEIENGELLDYFDVDLVSNDSLLQRYLNSNNDARLKSIVSTIQLEQNKVIRRNVFDNIIVQGVAGSGKTTVALHRIAYLVYNYIETIRQSQYLVIGPNPIFMKYINSVLPDLDVDGVGQCTYEEFVKEYLGEDINIRSSEKKINNSIAGVANDVDKFKCSMKYKEMIDGFLNFFAYGITSSSLMIGSFEVLPAQCIQDVFSSIDSRYDMDLQRKINLVEEKLYRIIDDDKESILSRYTDYCFEVFKGVINESERSSLRKKFSRERKEINGLCKNIIRRYFSKYKLDATKIYKTFLSSIDNYNYCNYDNLDLLKKATLDGIKENQYDFEDLAALLYIKSRILPNREYSDIRHVVVDEAQDFGEFNFYSLKQCLPSATFSIFGDLAQSIYDYRGIDNWEDINNTMFNNEGYIVYFNKSYRTTSEIMEIADVVAESMGLNCSEDVIRHGEEVSFTAFENDEDIPQYIADRIMYYKGKGYKSIAVISKTRLLSNYINDDLSFLGMRVPEVTMSDDLTDDLFQVCTISNQLAKGLEFDAVIINNASERIYSSSSVLDSKLLYVAITRALHELDIVYSGEINKNLGKCLVKGNKQV